ncbi:molybdate transport system substrate-binding protein [Aquimarina sp. MAR_2010_214]|uniref:molybdate ABC transporter substrate-binding protein n=1 Tax=Aquimarina sp. MAR_2010_214 TaxID=1250026 RepID=UPI000C6FD935|nr:molybdate ABC transporter substrate-binding protein [Aquimarina sp. MAR_2010_214]PKV49066.1 molybdate transport system substrate-binding protein [Aquimarina sp. MAR_2010_214]
MKKAIFIFLTYLTVTTTIGCQRKQEEKLTIAVAANMQFAMKELSKAFTVQTGIVCDLIISSSGKLTAQIKEGAPFDIFVSANMKYPKELFNSGFATKAPKIYGYGKLVMGSMIDSIHPSLEILKSSKINHIAIANPKMAPYGMATIEVLKKHNLYESVKNKLVYGESILQTNQFIISKSAEIGFTSKSVVLSPEMNNKGNWIDIEDTDHSAIAQGVVILNHNNQEKAKKFYDFLSSAEARRILESFGYLTKEN